ncbi:hypothetical protein ACFXK0_21360 [Nocardia sp. NPDC059177]|uniref:hypothetical protein n=1 Tax=Nocardia sp. NPDC059177 TaxID=3346759 RepID=UPI0036D0B59F
MVKRIRAAAVQAEPAWLSLPAGVAQTIGFFADGAAAPVVHQTELGRIGMLSGAEHLDADRRAHLWREQVHVAAFSGFTVYQAVGEGVIAVNSTVAQEYARANGVVVIAPTALVPMTGWAVVDAHSPEFLRLSGGGGVARIFGPDGRDLVAPLPPGKPGLLFADVVVDEAAGGRDYSRAG